MDQSLVLQINQQQREVVMMIVLSLVNQPIVFLEFDIFAQFQFENLVQLYIVFWWSECSG